MKGKRREQTGSSMLEVLVSLVVLAIGVLGMSALLTSSLKGNQSSYLRTQATFLSQDIGERMRANQVGITAGNYNNPTPGLTASCLTPAGCTAAQMAAHDVAEWQGAVVAALPLGSGVICVDSTPTDGTPAAVACDGLGNVYAVKIWWDDDRDGTAEQRYVTTFQP